ncbi:hypothetical protein ACVWXN_005543 [Bradyrhizobium sp. i1.4.4]
MRFTDIFIKRPVLSVVVSLLILLIGLRAAMVLPIRQYPKLSNTVINITTVYPGASADLIQGFITTPIEQAVASAEGVDYMTSSSVLGTSTIQVYIKLNLRSEPGAHRGARQDQLGQVPDSKGIQRPDRHQDHRPDHGRDVSRLLLRGAVGLGDIRLSDACGAAGAVDGRRRGLGRHSGRPDLCDAAVARSHEDGRPQRVAGRCRRRDRRQQLPVRSGADQGLSDRFQHLDEHQPD